MCASPSAAGGAGAPTVVVLQRRLTAYRLAFFDGLREALSREKIALSLVYGEPSLSDTMRGDGGELGWGQAVSSWRLRLGGANLMLHRVPLDRFLGKGLVILPHEGGLALNHLLGWRLRGTPTRLALWGHGRNFQGTARGMANRIKNRMARRADWWFAYTRRTADYLTSIGYPEGRITCVNNATDTRLMALWRGELEASECPALLMALGMSGRRVGLFLGSLIPEKRLDLLFASADAVRAKIPEFELIVAGEGPLRAEVHTWAAERPWVKIVGVLRGRDKVIHTALAHVMLNPGMTGLSILDAFAAGVPYVTTDCGIHSPEIAYLKHGENGLMTAPSAEAFADAACTVLTDPALAARLAHGGAETAKTVTLEAMVQTFADGIRAALAAPPL